MSKTTMIENKAATTLYLDCISGIAGDMTLAALVDIGADVDYVVTQLRQLPLDHFEMSFDKVDRRGITSLWLNLQLDDHGHEHNHTHDHDHYHYDHAHEHSHPHDHGHHHHDHAHEHSHPHDHGHHHHDHAHEHSHPHDHGHHHHDHDHEHSHPHDHGHHHHEHDHKHSHPHDHGHHHHHDHHHRKAADIIAMIEQSAMPMRVKERSVAIFTVIAEAEGKIHGVDPAEVHFHEVGAMDSIIDVIGVCLALESLGVAKIMVSPVPVGTGRIKIAHGVYPVPAPATAEILRGVPLSAFTAEGELTTPTGAGIVKALATSYGTIPAGTMERIGYGAGTKNFAHPNVVRAILINEQATIRTEERIETIHILEAQVDDMTGEALGYTMEALFAAGALDVYYTSVYMKKNRPGVLITVLSEQASKEQLEQILFRETTTIGVRSSTWQRTALKRQWIEVQTAFGAIKVKQALQGTQVMKQSPEYEDVHRAAKLHQVTLEEVYQAVFQQL
ncbi:nickel pincer cofactor biosynthesis protein LarC [Paenibacillus yanchengensis]|uniref:Pyridinium-3,5-bisthiocarboxylic acid mononucleotide nickel insertion protein n=1 Tax=Paenibacillus yanchengensis TaxID=2035833 RepID=A0ABW4YGL6_9BACL